MNNNAVDPVQGLRWGPRCNLDRCCFVWVILGRYHKFIESNEGIM